MIICLQPLLSVFQLTRRNYTFVDFLFQVDYRPSAPIVSGPFLLFNTWSCTTSAQNGRFAIVSVKASISTVTKVWTGGIAQMVEHSLSMLQLARLCAHESLVDAAVRWFAVRKTLYKGTLVRNPRCSKRRRIDKAGISTLVIVHQCAANCLEEAVRLFAAMRIRCRSSRVDFTSVVHCQFFELFGDHRSTAFKLASLWNCSAAQELLLCDRKNLLLEGR
ncbi:uncharacterized protein TNCV_4188031 [Trichonephila clavipes]|nr:uncharacterized protein TNCV_4188031 [Trichonephila clavipes]